MLSIGLLTTTDRAAIENLRNVGREVYSLYTEGNPLTITVNQRARMEMSSLSPLVVTREYGTVFNKGPQLVGSLSLATIVNLTADEGEVAPLMAVEAPNSVYYGITPSVRLLNQLGDALGMGVLFKQY